MMQLTSRVNAIIHESHHDCFEVPQSQLPLSV
jgi:hypothetical protein